MKGLIGSFAILLLSAITTTFAAEPAPTPGLLLSKNLSDLQNQEAIVLSVTSLPGAASLPHQHNADTFVYVLEGSMIMAVKGGDEVTLHPGDTFYESRTDVHSVSRNASATEPAKFLVFMIKNQGAPISVVLE